MFFCNNRRFNRIIVFIPFTRLFLRASAHTLRIFFPLSTYWERITSDKGRVTEHCRHHFAGTWRGTRSPDCRFTPAAYHRHHRLRWLASERAACDPLIESLRCKWVTCLLATLYHMSGNMCVLTEARCVVNLFLLCLLALFMNLGFRV